MSKINLSKEGKAAIKQAEREGIDTVIWALTATGQTSEWIGNSSEAPEVGDCDSRGNTYVKVATCGLDAKNDFHHLELLSVWYSGDEVSLTK